MKRSEAARYARWSALTALTLASLTGAVYLYRQWVAHVERVKAPPPLTEEKERQSIGLTISKNEGERTVFTVKASKSTDLKGQDISLLEEVQVTNFGKLGDRHDVIHSHSCRYAKTTGGIECSGEVQIDLESAADAQKTTSSSSTKPNLIHVETSGVTFNAKSGKAETVQPVKFTMPNGEGDGIGATYLSQDGLLRLEKNVRISLRETGALAVGKKPNAPETDIVLHGSSMEMGKQTRKVVLAGPATAVTPTQQLSAGELILLLDDENRAQTMLAQPGTLNQTPELTSKSGKGPMGAGILRANLMKANLAPEGWVRDIDAEGNLQGKSENGDMQADSGHVDMWPKVNQAKLMTLHGNVRIDQKDPKTGLVRKLNTAAMQMSFAGGKPGEPNPVQHAETLERGTMEWSDTATSQSKLTADKLSVDFGEAGKAKSMVATGNVFTQRDLQGQPSQTATANNGDAQLDPGGSWTQMTLRGNVHMKQADRSADAQQAVFTRAAQTTVLTGQAVARDEGSETRASRITFHQDTGDIEAEGKVRSTDLGTKEGDVHLSNAPSNITAERMTGNSKTGRALYTGHARLWQGPSVLEADSIELFRDTRQLNATGNVRAVFPKQTNDLKTDTKTAAKTDNKTGVKGKDDQTWHVSSGTLKYWDAENRAHLEKNVVVVSADEKMRGPVLDIYFVREPDAKTGSTGASKINRAVGTGGVEVQQGDRRGTAERGVYTAVDDKFVLSGGTPTLYDSEEGTTTGRELTFNIADDTIIVDSGNGSRTLTRHRVQR
jgi:lipopolysaccharide export system protein LptA